MTKELCSFVCASILVLSGCPGSGPPDIKGYYKGPATQTTTGCQNEISNGTTTVDLTATIATQNGSSFTGMIEDPDNYPIGIEGTVSSKGRITGSLMINPDVHLLATFTGTVKGTLLEGDYTGRAIVEETCMFQGHFSLTKLR